MAADKNPLLSSTTLEKYDRPMDRATMQPSFTNGDVGEPTMSIGHSASIGPAAGRSPNLRAFFSLLNRRRESPSWIATLPAWKNAPLSGCGPSTLQRLAFERAGEWTGGLR